MTLYMHYVPAIMPDECITCSCTCICCRGKQFRQDYDRLGELRSILPSHVPVMALTATASCAVYETAVTVLGMKDPVLVAAPPSKSNLFFCVVGKKGLLEIAQDIAVQVHRLAKEDPRMYPKTIVFCRRYFGVIPLGTPWYAVITCKHCSLFCFVCYIQM